MAESINLYNSIYTIRDTRNRLKRALIRLGMLEGDWHEEEQLGDRADRGFSLLDCRDAINNMGGDVTLTNRTRMNVATKKRVRAYDDKLIASNIKKGVKILGVTGSYGGSGSTQTPRIYFWKYGTATAPSTTPPGPYSKLTPRMAAADSSLTLRPENIRKGVDIMGVIGTYDYMHMCGLHGFTAATSATRYEVNLESLPYCPYSGYDTITEQNIQTGWITTNGRFDLNSDYFTDEVRYIVGAKFGKNLYHSSWFLVLDTLIYVTCVTNNWTGWTTRYERYYVNEPFSVLGLRHNSSTGFPTLTIDLSGATYKLFNSNEPSGSNVDIDIRFLTSTDFEHMALDGGSPSGGTRQYHADIRW